MDETAIQVKVQNYPESLVVNAADTWDEGLWTYPGRSAKLLPEGDARPEGAMTVRDGRSGFAEVSSGRSTCRLSRKGSDIRSWGVTPELELLQ